MFALIARLRTKPLEYRRRVAFWGAAAITGVIILMWLVSLSVRFGGNTDTSSTSTVPGPFESLVEQVKNAF